MLVVISWLSHGNPSWACHISGNTGRQDNQYSLTDLIMGHKYDTDNNMIQNQSGITQSINLIY